jgi:hypothetical protein
VRTSRGFKHGRSEYPKSWLRKINSGFRRGVRRRIAMDKMIRPVPDFSMNNFRMAGGKHRLLRSNYITISLPCHAEVFVHELFEFIRIFAGYFWLSTRFDATIHRLNFPIFLNFI